MKLKHRQEKNSTTNPRVFKLLNYDFVLADCQCCEYRANKKYDTYYNHNSRSWKSHRKNQYKS